MHTHTEHTYTPSIDSWDSPERVSDRMSLPLNPYLGSHLPFGVMLLWDCGDGSVVRWWPWEGPQQGIMVLFGLPFMCHCISVLPCGCVEELLSHDTQVLVFTENNLYLVVYQPQEVPHWGCVEAENVFEGFAFGIIFVPRSFKIQVK